LQNKPGLKESSESLTSPARGDWSPRRRFQFAVFLGLAGISPDCRQERFAGLSRPSFSVQDVSKRNECSVEKPSFVFVLCNDRAAQVNSCEETPSS
jgi:hypothetical protein